MPRKVLNRISLGKHTAQLKHNRYYKSQTDNASVYVG